MSTSQSLPHPNCYRIPGSRVIAGEFPNHADPGKGCAKIRGLLDAGVTAFVDLTRETELLTPYHTLLREEAEARGVEITYRRLPIVDNDVPTPERMVEILDHIAAAEAAGRTVYVHCWGGVGRTGTVVGCYLVRSGMSGAEALAKVGALFSTMSSAKKHEHRNTGSPQTEAQRDFVRSWVEHAAEPAREAGAARGLVEEPADMSEARAEESGIDIDAILRELETEMTPPTPTLLPVICTALEQRGFRYVFDEASSRVSLDFKGDEAVFECFLGADEKTRIVGCYVRDPLWVPEESRLIMCEAIVRANFGLPFGNFEMDMSDGELRFRASVDVEGGELVPTMVDNLIGAGISTCNRYHPAFMRVIYGGVTPRQAIEEAES